nr:MAG TPA: hypothetical protein [Caudoviricetes sp.]
MTRKDILKKYGFSWMSNVNLKEELSEQEAAEFEDLIRTLSDHNRGPAPPETGWKNQGKRFANMKNMKKREDDQHEFVRACDELKTELKKTRMYKMITRLLDWLAEKI